MSILETALSRRFDRQMDCPNWEAFITACGDYFADYIAAVLYLTTNTWRDTAEGVWLDRIGELVGVSRPGAEETDRVFRCRANTDPDYDPLHGFGTAPPPASNLDMGGWLWSAVTGIPTSDPAADDATYLDFQAAKIAATNADASIPGLARFVRTAFGVDCTVTASLYRVNIELLETLDLRKRRFLEFFLPIVAGVDCVITNWPDWGA